MGLLCWNIDLGVLLLSPRSEKLELGLNMGCEKEAIGGVKGGGRSTLRPPSATAPGGGFEATTVAVAKGKRGRLAC